MGYERRYSQVVTTVNLLTPVLVPSRSNPATFKYSISKIEFKK
ncbi:hypothetical protein CKA32_005123 [Geitlerinema sp. FC II]|nr:hypothetical protein CKA32_005123 [Geitlerinema sp. FC II]